MVKGSKAATTASPKKEVKIKKPISKKPTKSQSSKFQAVVEAAADNYTSSRRQTRSETKDLMKKGKVLTRGKEDEISRSKSNLSTLAVEEGKKKKTTKKDKKKEEEEDEDKSE